MMKTSASLLFTLLLACPAMVAAVEGRHALVMGVSDYTDPNFPDLASAGADASKMGAKLRELGFEVTVVLNPTLSQASKAVDAFGAILKTSKGMALFYFNGHVCENAGTNFLVPSDATVKSRANLNNEALSIQRLLSRMQDAGTEVNLVFLDCHRNDLTTGDRKLPAMRSRDTFIGFATASARLPENPKSSPYTAALLHYLGSPGLTITEMHALVSSRVRERTNGQQTALHSSELQSPFVLVPRRTDPMPRDTPPSMPPPSMPPPSKGDPKSSTSKSSPSKGMPKSSPRKEETESSPGKGWSYLKKFKLGFGDRPSVPDPPPPSMPAPPPGPAETKLPGNDQTQEAREMEERRKAMEQLVKQEEARRKAEEAQMEERKRAEEQRTAEKARQMEDLRKAEEAHQMALREAEQRKTTQQAQDTAEQARRKAEAGELDQQLQKLKSGTVAFNTPPSMHLEEKSLIHLMLSPFADDVSIKAKISGGGPVVMASARYSSSVEARLTGEGFRITPATKERQPVSDLEPTEWRWEVIPQAPGSHRLYLSLYALVTVEGERQERLLKTFERQLDVTVDFSRNPIAFLRYHPGLLIAGLALAGLGLAALWAYLRFARRVRASGGSWRNIIEPLKTAVFLSYSSKDRAWVTDLATALRSRGVTVWMDLGGIAPATFWGEQIAHALSVARVVVVVGSRHAFASPHVAREISLASQQNKTILPLVLDGSAIPPLLSYPLAGLQVTPIDPQGTDQAVDAVMSVPGVSG